MAMTDDDALVDEVDTEEMKDQTTKDVIRESPV